MFSAAHDFALVNSPWPSGLAAVMQSSFDSAMLREFVDLVTLCLAQSILSSYTMNVCPNVFPHIT